MPCFRESKSSHPYWNLTKTFIHIIFFWSLFLWIIPSIIYRAEIHLNIAHFIFPYQLPLAVGIFILASVLGLSSGITMSLLGEGTPLPVDCCKRLVVRGPYRYVRNPMAIAGLTQGAAVGLGLGSWMVLLYVIVGMFSWDKIVRPQEEADLLKRFAQEYEEYCRQIKCWIPSFKGFQS